MVTYRSWFLVALIAIWMDPPSHAASPTWKVLAEAHEKRVDLLWSPPPGLTPAAYRVESTLSATAPFLPLHAKPHLPTVYSHFLGSNGPPCHYRVLALNQEGELLAISESVQAAPRSMSGEELLTSVQQATFRYFWDFAHPVSGLARERNTSLNTVTTGGSGFGLMSILVGVERGFVERTQAAQRILTMLRFLQDKADRFHGAWPHWLHGATGRTQPFSRYDDGADLVETAFLVQGLLTVRAFFQGTDPAEREIRRRCTELWEEVEWDWFLGEPPGRHLFWHWSPRHGWKMNHRIGGHFNEAMIVYLLAMASPSHPIPTECYEEGWVGQPPNGYLNGTNYYGLKLTVGLPYGGPLFFTHYSFLGFDPRGRRDRYVDYFENNRRIVRIHQSHAIANPGRHKGYGPLLWGLTASDTPGGYTSHAPDHDNGTVTPSAALASMPYAPEAAMATLQHLYHEYGPRLWGEFGFKDAFNLDQDWFADSYLAIDQGPIIIMIENHRSGLCWNLFMQNKEILDMLDKAGWSSSP